MNVRPTCSGRATASTYPSETLRRKLVFDSTVAEPAQFVGHAGRAVGTLVPAVNGADLGGQLVLGLGALLAAGLGGQPLVVALPTTHRQDAAQPRDAIGGVVFGDEPVAVDHRPISFAKYWAALRRISFSSSSSATFLRNRRSSSRSSAR
jgi:hypothetical protein